MLELNFISATGGELAMTTNPLNPVKASEEIVIDFWQSLCKLPRKQNPTFNNDGARDIDANNFREGNKDFFYLSVTHEGPNIRECTVDSDQKVLVPSLSFLASEAERPESSTNKLNSFSEIDHDSIDQVSRHVTIDGNDISNLDSFRVPIKTAFQVFFPDPNLFSARPGDSDAVADGAYLVLQGFEARSHHIIHFAGTVNIPENQDSLEYRTYNEDLTYKLTII
jgi:hypothetical protein